MYSETILIDDRMGIIKNIRKINHVELPSLFTTFTAESNKVSTYLNWRPDYVGSGTSLNSKKAYYAAIGELIERYCGNYIPENLLVAKTKDLINKKFVSPSKFIQFADYQYNKKFFPFERFNDEEELEWVEGKCLISGENYLIPAKFVYLNYWMYRRKKLKIKQSPILLSGVAAGQDISSAIISGLLEIIERDTTMIWWIGKRSQSEIQLNKNDPLYKEIIIKLPSYLKIRWFLLPSDFKVYTVAASLIDYKNKIFSIGFATRFSIYEAMEKSAAEAIQLRTVSLDMLNPNSPVWTDPENKEYLGIKEYRPDRKYRESFKSDWSDMISLKHNVQYFLDPETWSIALNRLENNESIVNYNEIKDVKEKNKLNYLINEYEKNNMSIYMVDLTTDDIKKTNYRVVRVLSPEACPNMPTGLPMLGNKRLLNATKVDKEGKYDFDLSPMPHS